MKADWLIVARDVLLILVLSTVGLFVTGMVFRENVATAALVLAPLVLTLGFCISGCLAKEGRVRHLALVAPGVWVVGSLIGVIEGRFDASMLALGLVSVVVAALLGGLLSFAIVRGSSDSRAPEA